VKPTSRTGFELPGVLEEADDLPSRIRRHSVQVVGESAGALALMIDGLAGQGAIRFAIAAIFASTSLSPSACRFSSGRAPSCGSFPRP